MILANLCGIVEKFQIGSSIIIQQQTLRKETLYERREQLGGICGDNKSILRKTPRGKNIVDFTIVYTRENGWKSHRIWCIAWGSAAYSISEKCEGDRVAFQGRFQSRYYIKALKNGKEEQRITYEVSSMKLVE